MGPPCILSLEPTLATSVILLQIAIIEKQSSPGIVLVLIVIFNHFRSNITIAMQWPCHLFKNTKDLFVFKYIRNIRTLHYSNIKIKHYCKELTLLQGKISIKIGKQDLSCMFVGTSLIYMQNIMLCTVLPKT